MSGGYFGQLKFKMSDLETMDGKPRPGVLPSDTNPTLINEYGWLWLNRDGSPTVLTDNVYRRLVGERASPAERFEANAYYLAGLTEYWRAHRNFAGVLHFVYLTGSFPGAFTSDHFTNVRTLELEPRFADYMAQAFHPLGVYLNFWQDEVAAGEEREYSVVLVNDRERAAEGRLALTLEAADGRELARAEQPFEVPSAGQMTYLMRLTAPAATGPALLQAAAAAGADRTVSRRKVVVRGR
jgi:hypothetical protein